MTKAYFSPSLNAFIPAEWKTDGTYPENKWPADAVAATEEEILMFWKINPPSGMALGNECGRPAWLKLPEKTKQELIAAAENKRDSLISTSMQSISFIQLKLQAGRQLSEPEKNKLNNVIDYIDALSAVETGTAPDIDWPELTV
ncbi:TPA: tail fiber assembly protein [Klebsiella quasipneumoniae subsp. similipneumoniae]